MITSFVLRQYNQVVTALVGLTLFLIHCTAGHIHFATDDRLEQFIFGFRYLRFASRYLRFLILTCYFTALYTGNPLFQVFYFPFRTTVLFINIVGEFLDTEHIAMIGNGNTFHTILHRLVYQTAHTGLAVKERILGMYVQMNKILHKSILSISEHKGTTYAISNKNIPQKVINICNSMTKFLLDFQNKPIFADNLHQKRIKQDTWVDLKN